MKPTFEVVLRSARGFLEAARLLETTHRHEAANLPVALDDAWLCRSLGMLTSATVLEALAVEQALKALLIRAQIAPTKTHDHRRLFDSLPQQIRQQAENEYHSRRHPMMRQTLPEALDFSAKGIGRIASDGKTYRGSWNRLSCGIEGLD
jgi:HEPN domain